jgi:hypothetical protein
MQKRLAALAAVLSLTAVPGLAAADASRDREPVKLTDAQLDDVAAGAGPPAFVLAAGHGPPFMRNQAAQPSGTQVNFLIKDVSFTFNVGPNSPVNLAAVFQFSLLSQANQSGAATALQTGH